MNILYVTNGFPFPLTSGFLRHYFLLRTLGTRHRITLVSLVNAEFRTEHADAVAEFVERCIPIPAYGRPNALSNKLVRQLPMLGRGAPVARRLAAEVGELVQSERYDVAVLCGRETIAGHAALGDLPVVTDLCDAGSVRLCGRMPYASASRRVVLAWQARHARRVEQQLIGSSGFTVFASARDREALAAGNPSARVVPNGVDLGYWRRSTSHAVDPQILFTGAMSYPPNEDAALLLAERIFPAVRQEVPGARLVLAGRNPTQALQRAGEREGVTVTGFRNDLRPCFESARVFAAPLRFGAGIQNKLLEAMAMELPIVASSNACDGLRSEEGESAPVAVCDEPGAFAARLVEYLGAREDHAKFARAGLDFTRRHFDWEQSARRFEAVLEEACSRGAKR